MAEQTARTETDEGGILRGASGPWGQFEYVRILVERPDEFLTPGTVTNRVTRWFFESPWEEQLPALLERSVMPAGRRVALLDTNRWERTPTGFYVVPGRDLILEMTPETRRAIYGVLAESPSNYFHQSVFAYRSDVVEEWFDQSGLEPRTVQLVQRLMYRQGTALCFSDVTDVMSLLPTESERLHLLKTLSRQSTVLMKLRVGPETDVDGLVRYWGKVGRAKDLRPLLESLKRARRTVMLDVAHLLTPFARSRLYSYPFPPSDPQAVKPNCFWTSMNYFREEPDDRYCEVDFTQRALARDYYQVPNPELVYGDLIFFYNAKGVPIHAAVYIADEIVFTKNGAHFNKPWILMDYRDLLAVYPSDPPLKVVAYRLKSL